MPTMEHSTNENELLKKINEFRSDIEQKNSTIEELGNQIRIYKKEAEEIRTERDNCNSKVKELSSQGKYFRDSRNKSNKETQEIII